MNSKKLARVVRFIPTILLALSTSYGTAADDDFKRNSHGDDCKAPIHALVRASDEYTHAFHPNSIAHRLQQAHYEARVAQQQAEHIRLMALHAEETRARQEEVNNHYNDPVVQDALAQNPGIIRLVDGQLEKFVTRIAAKHTALETRTNQLDDRTRDNNHRHTQHTEAIKIAQEENLKLSLTIQQLQKRLSTLESALSMSSSSSTSVGSLSSGSSSSSSTASLSSNAPLSAPLAAVSDSALTSSSAGTLSSSLPAVVSSSDASTTSASSSSSSSAATTSSSSDSASSSTSTK